MPAIRLNVYVDLCVEYGALEQEIILFINNNIETTGRVSDDRG